VSTSGESLYWGREKGVVGENKRRVGQLRNSPGAGARRLSSVVIPLPRSYSNTPAAAELSAR
jgi:hypothetical protein